MNILLSESEELVISNIIATWADGIPDWVVFAALLVPIIAIVGVFYGLNLMFRGAREAEEADSIEDSEPNQENDGISK